MKYIITKKLRFFIFFVLPLLFYYPAFAMVFSEIDFDPTGADDGREWVEVYNDSGSGIDLSTIKFVQGGTNHGITALSDKNLAPGEYAVIIQDLNKFKTDFPNYTGKTFKASFSLSNSGETLSLKDSAGNILNSVTYSASQSGAGNGYSVSFDGSNFSKTLPNPGTGNITNINNNTNTNTSTSTQSTTTNQTSTTTSTTTLTGSQESQTFSIPIYYYRSYFPESQKIYTYAGENKIVPVGSDVFFSAKSITGDGRDVYDASFFWNFGDGQTGEGQKVRHVYKYTGEYVVDLEGYGLGTKSEDRIYLNVVDPNLSVSIENFEDTKRIKIENKSNFQIDVGGYLLKTFTDSDYFLYDKVYTINNRTIILPNKSIYLSQDLVKFATSTNHAILMFTSGKKISEASFLENAKNENSTSTKELINKQTVFTKKIKKIVVNNISRNNPGRSSVSSSTLSTTTNKFIIKNEERTVWGNLMSYFGI